MNLSTWAIRKPIPPLLIFGLLTFAGLVGFMKLPVQDMPDLALPTVTVTANLPGATPSALETEVTRKIEDQLATLGSIKHMTSTINDGTSMTVIEFELGKDVQEAVNDVRDAVSSARGDLPGDLLEPLISRATTTGGAVLTYQVESAAMDEAALSWFVDNEISKQLFSLKGVGEVTRQGGVTREIRVEPDPDQLLALGVTAGEISSRLREVRQESPGGRIDLGGMEQSVRTIATVGSAAEIAALDIPLADGRHVRFGAIATVTDTAAERREMAFVDGKPAVTFEVKRATGASEVAVAVLVRERVEKLRKDFPHVRLREINDSIEPVLTNYGVSMHSLYEGAILAVIVVWLFLRDWRATLISAVALPLSIIPTFIVIHLLGYQLNSVTLLALTLIVGVLVDDAIVEVENIMRHLRDGKSAMDAALEAASEIGLAVVATSLTLVAVFLPTAFMGGIPGMFFVQFGWTAAIAVLFSLLVARLLTPMMAAYLMKPQTAVEKDGRITKTYMGMVRWCLGHPVKVMIATGVFLAGSVGLSGLLSTTFMGAEDQSQISVTVEAPPGSGIGHTAWLAEQARKIISEQAGVRNVHTVIGAGSSGGMGESGSAGEVRKATLNAALVAPDKRDRTQQEIETELRGRFREIAGARFAVGGGGSGEKVSLVLAGDDQHSLAETARRVMAELRTLPDLGNITSSASLLRPEVIIRPDFALAAELGVSAEALGEAVRIATTGDYDQNLPRLDLPNRQLYIRTQFSPGERRDLATLRHLRVAGKNGAVPLGNVATIAIEGGPAQIDRFDRSRNITIDIELQGRPTGDVLEQVDTLPSLKQLPPDVRRIESGDAEQMSELFESFGLAMAAGVLCVFAVLVLLFHDFMQPLTILAALPLSLGGAFGALALTGHSMSMPSLIGLVMLMGIVTKNSILLVEYAIMSRREHGLGRTEAILDACHKRAQPIVMTTIAMVAGMAPMALGLQGSAEFRAPMAVAVIGGLVTSTALSLLVVPVLFELVDEVKIRMRRAVWRDGNA
ncbi:efflux RND transporter permease subunit [Luteolibacter yonseiensis]|uniref:Efflux RND transporter permease subunit n=1 Tax=Luteolibacter yonseiensis TaxID=1144680 RepID=A0A934QZN2_9BACT|nr:efflux RND transporter permease subunit [Luteolibacter yonseiensis]MBK1814019.1 efflux RND transporter permease subunit [Luteolibacter yonseiensis]